MDVNRERLFHIGLSPDQGAHYALLTGDPGRVAGIAEKWLKHPRQEGQQREFTTWSGELDGERVLVISHGIGGPSTAICVEELARCGVHTMIRAGTCGGMQLDVLGGDIVIATAAIRQEGTSLEYLPVEFPAAADFHVCMELREAAVSLGKRLHMGVVHCKDSFYGQHDPASSPVADKLVSNWKTWIRGGCLASEMESAALFILAASRGIRAGCVLQAIWNQERENAGLDNPRVVSAEDGIEVAVEALRRLICADRQQA